VRYGFGAKLRKVQCKQGQFLHYSLLGMLAKCLLEMLAKRLLGMLAKRLKSWKQNEA